MSDGEPATGRHDEQDDAELSAAERHPVSWWIFALARSHRALAGQLISPLGLFPGQELILMQLWDADGRSQKELGELQRVDHSTISKSVARLETAGLVERRKSTDDARVTEVHLTPAGRELEARVRSAWAELERRTTVGMTASERRRFVALARKIAPNLDEPE